ncbi:Serine/threonine-protein kinase AfsK [Streptomyces hundungensis]|uniref:Serine/threonine-protein kinase AfsK n=1 Tax=Streptomyces hundungensis TaxID=1077946 RepID=A0A387HPA1_9ACTN|nr:serine/threonine-protein kinase [Streptomyces hundungensis]AYG84651.1 Serine/threonine-protein kinase AfsK [Streptomyces hundungensis]
MTAPLRAGDPREVGGHRLLGRLGGGGLGTVFLGRSRSGRLLAVRVVAPELAADGEFRRRFEELVASARAVSSFHTAQVVDGAADGAVPWLASEYIAGPSLREAVTVHGPLPVEAVRALGSGLAEALAGVHAAGLLHGGLTPGDVILADDGPRLTDFALARLWDAAHPSRTVAAAPGGIFLAPEQVRTGTTLPASDVFALGGVLVFAATGRNAFGSASGSDALIRVVYGEPDLDGVPAEVRDLIRSCLAKDPAQRPPVGEVLRSLAGNPPDAWLPSAVAGMVGERKEQAGVHGAARGPGRRALLLAAGAGVIGLVGVPVGIRLGAGDAPGTPRPTGTPPAVDGASAPEAVRLGPATTIELGRNDTNSRSLAYSPDGKLLAVGALNKVVLIDPVARTKTGEIAFDRALGYVSALAFSPADGMLAAVYPLPPDPGSGEPQAREHGRVAVTLWNVASRREVLTLSCPSEGNLMAQAHTVAFSPDGRRVALGRDGRDSIGKAVVWEVSSGKQLAFLPVGPGSNGTFGRAGSVVFSPDGKVLAVGYGSELKGAVDLFDTASFAPIATLALEKTDLFGVTALAYAPDGRTLYGAYGGIAAWDTASRRLTTTLAELKSRYQSLSLSPDGKMLAGAGSVGGGLAIWALPSGRQTPVTTGRTGTDLVAFGPDGKTIATCTDTAELLAAVQIRPVA